MTITGALWYQGESDTGSASDRAAYGCKFKALILDWRRAFHLGSGGETSATFPFGAVQLAPWGGATPDSRVAGNVNESNGIAFVRAEQQAVLTSLRARYWPRLWTLAPTRVVVAPAFLTAITTRRCAFTRSGSRSLAAA